MRKPFWMALRFAAIVLLVTATAVVFAPPSSRSGTPYLSALSDLAGSDAIAAHKNNCRSICEFVAPAHTCLSEGSGSRCVKSATGGCTTVAC